MQVPNQLPQQPAAQPAIAAAQYMLGADGRTYTFPVVSELYDPQTGKLLTEMYMTDCGHLFSMENLSNIEKYMVGNKCPQCPNTINAVVQNRPLQNMIALFRNAIRDLQAMNPNIQLVFADTLPPRGAVAQPAAAPAPAPAPVAPVPAPVVPAPAAANAPEQKEEIKDRKRVPIDLEMEEAPIGPPPSVAPPSVPPMVFKGAARPLPLPPPIAAGTVVAPPVLKRKERDNEEEVPAVPQVRRPTAGETRKLLEEATEMARKGNHKDAIASVEQYVKERGMTDTIKKWLNHQRAVLNGEIPKPATVDQAMQAAVIGYAAQGFPVPNVPAPAQKMQKPAPAAVPPMAKLIPIPNRVAYAPPPQLPLAAVQKAQAALAPAAAKPAAPKAIAFPAPQANMPEKKEEPKELPVIDASLDAEIDAALKDI